MKIGMRFAAAILLALSSQPATAAGDFRDAARVPATSAFVGIRLQMNMGATHRPVPNARFAMGLVRHDGAHDTALLRPTRSWLELGLSRSGRAEFFVAGQQYTDVRNRLGIDQTTVAVIGLGVIAVAAAVAVSMNDEDDDDAHCLGVGVCPE